ncbi:hypothetical protein Dsin_015691 [Dipteronia sinensis]|uniref:Reverse transcriptase n=1 Tax=Dipteronia sinensis TaxID=43782 RepID=A0AAE0AD18_9ROSI|nr:hypothetical protein Dsin_015691 [Dipteronia sinensis]
MGRFFSKEYVKVALFSMGPTKAPWPDEFYALLFQKFWEVVWSDVSLVCLRILNGECSIKDFNKTNVVLISKKKNPVNLKDFRPVSLCSVVYMIVTKVMANRLKMLL